MINISEFLIKGFILMFLFTLIVLFSSYYKYYEYFRDESIVTGEFSLSLAFITMVIFFMYIFLFLVNYDESNNNESFEPIQDQTNSNPFKNSMDSQVSSAFITNFRNSLNTASSTSPSNILTTTPNNTLTTVPNNTSTTVPYNALATTTSANNAMTTAPNNTSTTVPYNALATTTSANNAITTMPNNTSTTVPYNALATSANNAMTIESKNTITSVETNIPAYIHNNNGNMKTIKSNNRNNYNEIYPYTHQQILLTNDNQNVPALNIYTPAINIFSNNDITKSNSKKNNTPAINIFSNNDITKSNSDTISIPTQHDNNENNWKDDYTILKNTWKLPIIHPPVCVSNNNCNVCPIDSSTYPLDLLKWNDSTHITY